MTLQTYTFVYICVLRQPQPIPRNYIVWWKNTVYINVITLYFVKPFYVYVITVL